MLISEPYRTLNRLHFLDDLAFGTGGGRYWNPVCHFAREVKAKTILDYGCGRGTLKETISKFSTDYKVFEYDPCFEGKQGDPVPADLVVCLAVLEHVEGKFLDNVIDHLFSLANKGLFIVTTNFKSGKTLADGSSPHRSILEHQEWKERILPHAGGWECKMEQINKRSWFFLKRAEQ